MVIIPVRRGKIVVVATLVVAGDLQIGIIIVVTVVAVTPSSSEQ